MPRIRPLTLLAVIVAIVLAVPVLVVAGSVLAGDTGGIWAHLASTVLPELLRNTLVLVVCVALGVGIMGVGCAWLVSMLDFPGRRVFEWALVLPLAMPAYVMAYVYTDLLQFVGPVQSGIRAAFHLKAGQYWFPNVRSVGGACLMFACVLYPYVYMLARTAFLERAGNVLDAARSLGQGAWGAFWRVSLPLARPAIVAGVSLALMETLADFGTVSYFGVQTFTTGIYLAWFSLGDRIAAAQLSAALLGVVALVLAMERLTRGRARFGSGQRGSANRRVALHGVRAWLAALACAVPLTLGFLLPAVLLLRMAVESGDAQFGRRYFELVGNSAILASVTALCAVLLAVVLGYAVRKSHARLPALLNRIVALGYAVPGSVIAVGILIPVARVNLALASLVELLSGHRPGLLLTGGITALVYAYLVRYLTVALGSVESGLARIRPAMDEAAQSLGSTQGEVLRRVHWPLLRGSLLTAALLVFVDVMKELPATLVMRPFDFDTLATQVYTLTADERLAEASTAALTIVAVGLLPVIVLSWRIARGR
ncbi:MAG: iron ABC transporter permease [Rhodocyclaceae bacterium]